MSKITLSVLTAGGIAVAALAANAGGYGPMRGGHGMMQRMDPDGDGKVVIEEVRADRLAELARFDADGDGQLSIEEYANLFAERIRPRMVDSFQRLDEDGDGVVTEAEATEPVTHMARRLDDNGDGVVDRDEFRKVMRGHSEGRRGGWKGRGEHRGHHHHDDRDDDDRD